MAATDSTDFEWLGKFEVLHSVDMNDCRSPDHSKMPIQSKTVNHPFSILRHSGPAPIMKQTSSPYPNPAECNQSGNHPAGVVDGVDSRIIALAWGPRST